MPTPVVGHEFVFSFRRTTPVSGVGRWFIGTSGSTDEWN